VAKSTGQSLTDLSLTTGFGSLVGTPEHMSPEQATLNNLDIGFGGAGKETLSKDTTLRELLDGAAARLDNSVAIVKLVDQNEPLRG
jgi:eukaryotic-like serine/threonine-protein kinase